MHDHPVAREIVVNWLQPDGPLGQISLLNDTGARMLDYIGPVAPAALLDRIEAEIDADDFKGMKPDHDPRRTSILNLLQSMAYEPNAFDRCMRLLLRVADFEDESNNYDAVRDKIVSFFQAYRSGTHATSEQRLGVIRECMQSDDDKRRSLGFRMLSSALDGPPCMGSGMNDFGARPRDFGYWPNHDQLVEWRSSFIDLAVELGTTDDPDLAGPARSVMAQEFRGLWHHEAVREKLVDAARMINDHEPWGEGWKAIRSTVYFDYTVRKPDEAPQPIPDSLAALQADLEPQDLLPTIRTYVLGNLCNNRAFDDPEFAEQRLVLKAEQLGADFATSGQDVSVLGSDVFDNEGMPCRFDFGKGLAKGTHDHLAMWQALVSRLEAFGNSNFNYSILRGFIKEVAAADPVAATELLDRCSRHPLLRLALVGLHPSHGFSVTDLDRCMAALEHPEVNGWMYRYILWHDSFSALPHDRIVNLAERLLERPNGGGVVLKGLCMRLRGTDSTVDTLGKDFRRIGLVAATQRLLGNQYDSRVSTDHDMERVVNAALRFEGNNAEKLTWLDSIFAVVDKKYGYMPSFNGTVQTTAARMPGAFLNRVFSGDQEAQRWRRYFIECGRMVNLPLSKIGIDALITWCQTQDNPEVWTVVGSCINHWVATEGEQSVALSDDAIKFLEAAPDALAALNGYASRIKPRVFSSGDRADVMQCRAEAIGALANDTNADIANAAQTVFAEATKRIESERQRERRRAEEREQTFE